VLDIRDSQGQALDNKLATLEFRLLTAKVSEDVPADRPSTA
jgi:hypothetical protein